jgi:chemotaxis protein CheD
VKTHTEGGHEVTPDRLTVGLSEWRVAAAGEVLVSHGVGASVVVALYDPESGVGGLVRAILPRRAGTAGDGGVPAKYADTGVQETLEAMIETGAAYAGVRGWLVGGSEPIRLPGLETGTADRTVAAAEETLSRLNVRLVGRAVGGDRGRTVELDTATGTASVTTAHGGTERL